MWLYPCLRRSLFSPYFLDPHEATNNNNVEMGESFEHGSNDIPGSLGMSSAKAILPNLDIARSIRYGRVRADRWKSSLVIREGRLSSGRCWPLGGGASSPSSPHTGDFFFFFFSHHVSAAIQRSWAVVYSCSWDLNENSYAIIYIAAQWKIPIVDRRGARERRCQLGGGG